MYRISRLKTWTAILLVNALTLGCVSAQPVANQSWKSKLRLQQFPGVWAESGTGRVLNISRNGVDYYIATQATCSLQERFTRFRHANRTFTKLKVSQDRKQFSVIPSGGTETLRLRFNRLTKLPASCVNAPNPEVFNPEFVFEHTWHLFNDYYPFFELYGVDWQQQYDTYRSSISADTNETELFVQLASMMESLDDGHISLAFLGENQEADFSPARVTGWNRHFAALADSADEDLDGDQVALSVLSDFNEFLKKQYGFTRQNGKQAKFKAWRGTGEGLPPLVWGKLQGNIGYLQVNSFGDNLSRERERDLVSSRRDSAKLDRVMNRVMRNLDATDGLIIDVRFNGGGFDAVALKLAERFADDHRLVLQKRKHGGLLDNANFDNVTETFYVGPHRLGSYTRPITLITGPDTASAAEVFTMAMRSFDHVTHIGESTQGILSNILPVNLDEQWALGLSHEVYYDAEGNNYEGAGIPPEHSVATASPKALNYGLFPAIDLALNKFGVLQPLTASEFDAQVAEIMQSGLLPGFSVAWVESGRRLAANAYGYANMAQGIPSSIDTPYKVGSISKTIIGISAAQMLERGLVDLDTPVANWLPFQLDHPQASSDTPTLRHLVTHTSGIDDSEAYGCGYYIEQDNSSLANALLGLPCPSPVETVQQTFLATYLQQDGQFYSADDNFIDAAIGEQYNYTNIGAALAAEVLAGVVGEGFEAWTEREIFAPLNMHNTHWFNRRFDENSIQPAKRYVLVDDEQLVELPEHALATWADGDLRTSAMDLSGMLLALADGDNPVLSEEGVAAMVAPQTELVSDESNQGIFWTNDGFLIGHDGGDPGVLANMQYSPQLDMGFVFMMNLSSIGDDSQLIVDWYSTLQKLIYQRGVALKNGY